MIVIAFALILPVRYMLQLLKLRQEVRYEVVVVAQLYESIWPAVKPLHDFSSPSLGWNIVHPVSVDLKE